MPVMNHVHTYVRSRSQPDSYFCEARDCTHIIKKEFILGKLSLCTECHSEMVLTREDLRRARPKCLNCAKTKKAKAHQKVQALALPKYIGTDNFNIRGVSATPSELSSWPSDSETWSELGSKEEEEEQDGRDRDQNS